MSTSLAILERSQNKCELCASENDISAYLVPPKSNEIDENQVVICTTCSAQLDNLTEADSNYWRCLNESMWSEVPAVQVLAYRILTTLSHNDWALDLKNMMYLDEAHLEWAEAGQVNATVIHKDSNGNILKAGDSVVLIKDLNVKGANFVAKRGTAVRRISLVADNAEHIEGKINGQHIVILTQYVKKS